MLELVRYFNEHYGQEYENIEYPTTKKEIYQTYQVVKSYGIKDDKLVELFNDIVLPKPQSIKEKEMYSECLYEVSGRYKRNSVLKLTKDDFIYNEEKRFAYYTQDKLSWLNTKEDMYKVGFKLKTIYEIQCSSTSDNYITEQDVRVLQSGELQYGTISFYYEADNCILGIANGVSLDDLESSNPIGSKLCISFLEMSKEDFDILQELEFELFKVEENKISQDVLPYKLEFVDDIYLDVTIDGQTLRFAKFSDSV